MPYIRQSRAVTRGIAKTSTPVRWRVRRTVPAVMSAPANMRRGFFMENSIDAKERKLIAINIKGKTYPSEGRIPPMVEARQMRAKQLVVLILSIARTARPPTMRQEVIRVITVPPREVSPTAVPVS